MRKQLLVAIACAAMFLAQDAVPAAAQGGQGPEWSGRGNGSVWRGEQQEPGFDRRGWRDRVGYGPRWRGGPRHDGFRGDWRDQQRSERDSRWERRRGRQMRDGLDTERTTSGSMMGGMMRPVMMRMMMALMDTDGDGAVSQAEFQAAHERIFRAFDVNKDGRLTSDEVQRFMQGESRADQEKPGQ